MTPELRCMVTVDAVHSDRVILSDVGNDTPLVKTVTNDAEAVVARCLAKHGTDKRIFYWDSDGEPGELLHDGQRFTGFGPADPSDLE